MKNGIPDTTNVAILPPTQAAAAPATFALCTHQQWNIVILCGLAASGLAWHWYARVSGWIGVDLFLMVATFMHLVFSVGRVVPMPHIAILISGLQYVLAAWLSYYFPPDNPVYDIAGRLSLYLSFASGVMLAVVLGWTLALWGHRHVSFPALAPTPELLRELDVLFWFGIVCVVLGHFVNLASLSFLLVLCANLRFVGALGRMMVSGPGWAWRIWVTLILELLFAARSTMFHPLLLWSTGIFALYIFKRRPGKMAVIGLAVFGCLLLPAMQQSKLNIRSKIAATGETGGSVASLANIKNVYQFSTDLIQGMANTVTGNLDSDLWGNIVLRYNQGWIINRVMLQVPAIEPYAQGETLTTAAKAALLPRLLFPNKEKAGGQVLMARFAGVDLSNSGTSMNLGYAGEMYANFGFWGGIAGCFVYALVLGQLFHWISVRAVNTPLWWAFVPYIGLVTLKAEDGIAEAANWVVKASVVTFGIYLAFPAIRKALSRKVAEDRAAMLRQMRRNNLKDPLINPTSQTGPPVPVGNLSVKEISE